MRGGEIIAGNVLDVRKNEGGKHEKEDIDFDQHFLGPQPDGRLRQRR
jgi:hypothetical protein